MSFLKYSPHDGGLLTGFYAVISAHEYRTENPNTVWFFNPWTGEARFDAHIEVDPFGHSIEPPRDQPVYAALMESAQEVLDAQPVPTEGRMFHDGTTLHVGETARAELTRKQYRDYVEHFTRKPVKETRDTANPKDAAGRAKVPLWLLSPIAKAAWAGAAFIGKVKYGAWNYRGTKVYASVYISAAMRHLDAYLSGETLDPEDGTHHLGNVMACCAILLDCAASGNLIDDRPPSVSLRPTYDEMQALVQPTEAKYADRTVKHWTIDDTKAP